MELTEEQKGLVIQACQMQVTKLFIEHDELVDINPDLIALIFNAGIITAVNSIDAVLT